MRAPARWPIALTASLAVHAAGAGLYLATQSLDDPPRQQSPKSRLQLDTLAAPTTRPEAQTPDGETVPEETAQSTALPANAVPRSDATPLTATGPTQEARQPQSAPLAATPSPGQSLSAADAPTQNARPAQPPATTATSQTLAADRARTQRLTGETAPEDTARATPLDAARPPQDSIAARDAPAARQAASAPTGERIASVQAPADQSLTSAIAPAQSLSAADAPTQTTSPARPPATTAPSQTLAADRAQTQRLTSESAPEDIARATPVDAARPPQDSIAARDAPAQSLTNASVTPTRLGDAPPATETVAPVSARTENLAATTTDATKLSGAAAPSQTLVSAAPRPAEALVVTAQPQIASLSEPQTATLEQQSAPADDVVLAAMPQDSAPAAAAKGVPAPVAPTDGQQLAAARASGERPAEPPLPASSTKADTAWRFGDRLVTDPTAVAAIQAFMTPEEPGAREVRDDLSALLGGIECARVSATFLPDDGVLELRGHVPDPSLRGPLLEALQGQVGPDIPVRTNLLHLPEPQCGALTGIAQVGLPQSTDQFTNARLIGETAQAREFAYTEGQRLQFDLVAPDYDAYVYVDYFSASGDVIHLVPNETIALENTPAKATFGVGEDRADRPSLVITIGPPFGQEIAVAFAASTPLYEGLRPISEPAEPYLAFLKDQIAAARAEDPDFKGEWVYFFITTQPASQ